MPDLTVYVIAFLLGMVTGRLLKLIFQPPPYYH